jgi:cytochrome c556
MQNLVRAVVLLDRPTIQVLANRIADEEVVARTTGIREKQPPVLPAAFFTTQDELAAAARQLAGAAVAGGDDKMLAERFGAMTRTCVSCHSAYLHDRPEPMPLHPKAKPEPPGQNR